MLFGNTVCPRSSTAIIASTRSSSGAGQQSFFEGLLISSTTREPAWQLFNISDFSEYSDFYPS
jgi:hypothetical protein